MLFGVDSKMNFHRSTNHGVSWKTISAKHFHDVKNETALVMSKGIPENMVSTEPDSFWSAVTSNGNKWAGEYGGVLLLQEKKSPSCG